MWERRHPFFLFSDRHVVISGLMALKFALNGSPRTSNPTHIVVLFLIVLASERGDGIIINLSESRLQRLDCPLVPCHVSHDGHVQRGLG